MFPNLLATAAHNGTTSTTSSPSSGAIVAKPERPGPRLGIFSDALPPALPRFMRSPMKRPRDEGSNIQRLNAVTGVESALELSAKKARIEKFAKPPNVSCNGLAPGDSQAPTLESAPPAALENEQMQQLRRIRADCKKRSNRQLAIPFKKYTSAIQDRVGKGKPKESDVVHGRRLFLARIEDYVIEEARMKSGRKDVNALAFHAGIIMLDELRMEVEEQTDDIKGMKSMNTALRRVLVESQERADKLTASLALQEIEATEFEETEAALVRTLDEVESTVVRECEARDARITELELLDEERRCMIAKLETVNKDQEFEIAELETTESHYAARTKQLETVIRKLSTSVFILKDLTRAKDVRIADLEALVQSQAALVSCPERGCPPDNVGRSRMKGRKGFAAMMNGRHESTETIMAGNQDAWETRPDVETVRLKRSEYSKAVLRGDLK